MWKIKISKPQMDADKSQEKVDRIYRIYRIRTPGGLTAMSGGPFPVDRSLSTAFLETADERRWSRNHQRRCLCARPWFQRLSKENLKFVMDEAYERRRSKHSVLSAFIGVHRRLPSFFECAFKISGERP